MQKQMADATSGRKAGCGRFPPTPCFPEERDGACWGWNAVRLPATHGEGETMQAEACDAEVVLTENNPLATASARTPRKWRNEMDDDIRTLLGERIRQLRKTRGWRQVDFAEKLGVSKQCVANWENGGFLPSILTLMRLCEVFSVSTDHLLGLDGHKRIDVTGLSDLQVAHLQTVADDMASDDSAPSDGAAPSDETAPSSDTVPTDGFDDQTAMGDDRKDAMRGYKGSHCHQTSSRTSHSCTDYSVATTPCSRTHWVWSEIASDYGVCRKTQDRLERR